MGLGDVSLACASALVDSLVRGGMRHACLSPGSRSTPLALALARHDGITLHIHLDERSSAFFALGIAKATGAPVAVACTSGTATAELFPAVVEASQSRVPLVLLTADRPPRLRGSGANQTIDQVRLYGRYARAYLEPPVPASGQDVAAWAAAGAKAVAAALGRPAGPVQVDCGFEEPLVPEGDSLAPAVEPAGSPVEPATTDTLARAPDDEAVRASAAAFVEAYAGRRGVIVIGGLSHPRSLAVLALGELLGWPVAAEPLSGLRLDASGAGRALAAGQFLLGDEVWLEAHRPDVVLQIGATPTTRATQALTAAAPTLVVLDRDHLDPDPDGRAALRLAIDPERFGEAAWDLLAEDRPPVPDGWADAWRAADLLARRAADRTIEAWDEPFEGRVARDIGAAVPNGGVLVVGSSTPVRDLDAFLVPQRAPRMWHPGNLVRTIANRGASGIDGTIATALGAAAAGVGPTFALMGDLTFLYDAGTLLWSGRRGLDAVLVVLANGGGQIFSLLPQRELPEHRELFVTPHGIDIAAVCAAAGVGHERVEHGADVLPAVAGAAGAGGVRVVEVTVDPALSRARRDEVRAAVAVALASAP